MNRFRFGLGGKNSVATHAHARQLRGTEEKWAGAHQKKKSAHARCWNAQEGRAPGRARAHIGLRRDGALPGGGGVVAGAVLHPQPRRLEVQRSGRQASGRRWRGGGQRWRRGGRRLPRARSCRISALMSTGHTRWVPGCAPAELSSTAREHGGAPPGRCLLTRWSQRTGHRCGTARRRAASARRQEVSGALSRHLARPPTSGTGATPRFPGLYRLLILC